MNKYSFSKKALAIGLCVALGVSSIGFSAYALNNSNTKQTQTTEKTSSDDNKENSKDITKDETVYVLAGADGSVKKIIVSDWVKNTMGDKFITDQSLLTDIENVKGDESYKLNGDNMKVWDAQGNDIYYKGNIDRELPVNLSVSYKLDGKSISAKDIAGKSGKVTIRFDYDNRQYEMVDIDGKQEKIYVPFAMLTGMLLDNDVFTNVEVFGGKLINDGDRTAVMGIAFPGLQENLNLSKEKLDIPDHFEITADAKNFAFGMTVTIATNEIFNEIDSSKLNSIDDLEKSLNQLNSGMKQLLDGSSALYGGLSTLLDKSGELTEGIEKLAKGAKDLKDGASSLDNGASDLKAGMNELYNGLTTLTANNDTLNGGAKQVFDTLLATANTQISAAGLSVPKLTISNYAEVLNGVIASLDETAVYNQALATVTAKVEENRPTIEKVVTDTYQQAVKQQVEAYFTDDVKASVRNQVAEVVIPTATQNQFTKETYDKAVAEKLIDESLVAQIEAAIDQQTAKTIEEQVTAKTKEQMNSAEIKSAIAKSIEDTVKQKIAEAMSSDEVQQQLAKASEGSKSIITLKSSLDSYNAFYLGLLTYTDGVKTATDGAKKLNGGAGDLKNGTAQLKNGVDQLFNGILTLKNGTPALVNGVKELKDGSKQLSDGLVKFDKDGISKLTSVFEDDIKGTLTRAKATVDVSKDYKNFSGLADGTEGKVKFIYRTEEIGK